MVTHTDRPAGPGNTTIQQPLHIENLTLPELHLLKRQVDEELTQLRANQQTLEEAVERYKSSSSALDQLHATPENSEMLVPLTASMYVPGKLIHTDKVLVDIGTGYHVHKKVADAHIYIEKNIEMVNKEVRKINAVIQEKQQLSDLTQHQIQQKYLKQHLSAE